MQINTAYNAFTAKNNAPSFSARFNNTEWSQPCPLHFPDTAQVKSVATGFNLFKARLLPINVILNRTDPKTVRKLKRPRPLDPKFDWQQIKRNAALMLKSIFKSASSQTDERNLVLRGKKGSVIVGSGEAVNAMEALAKQSSTCMALIVASAAQSKILAIMNNPTDHKRRNKELRQRFEEDFKIALSDLHERDKKWLIGKLLKNDLDFAHVNEKLIQKFSAELSKRRVYRDYMQAYQVSDITESQVPQVFELEIVPYRIKPIDLSRDLKTAHLDDPSLLPIQKSRPSNSEVMGNRLADGDSNDLAAA